MQIAVPNDVQQAAYITYQSYHLQAAQKEPYKKKANSWRKMFENFLPQKANKKRQKHGP